MITVFVVCQLCFPSLTFYPLDLTQLVEGGMGISGKDRPYLTPQSVTDGHLGW